MVHICFSILHISFNKKNIKFYNYFNVKFCKIFVIVSIFSTILLIRIFEKFWQKQKSIIRPTLVWNVQAWLSCFTSSVVARADKAPFSTTTLLILKANLAVVRRSLESWRRQHTFRCVYAYHLSLEASSESSACVGDLLTPPTRTCQRWLKI